MFEQIKKGVEAGIQPRFESLSQKLDALTENTGAIVGSLVQIEGDLAAAKKDIVGSLVQIEGDLAAAKKDAAEILRRLDKPFLSNLSASSPPRITPSP